MASLASGKQGVEPRVYTLGMLHEVGFQSCDLSLITWFLAIDTDYKSNRTLCMKYCLVRLNLFCRVVAELRTEDWGFQVYKTDCYSALCLLANKNMHVENLV